MADGDIQIWPIILLGIVAWYIIRSLGQIKIDDARRHLAEGAMLLDVRTPQEYGQDHIEGAVNLPLAQLTREIGSVVKNKETTILCHCLSGVRSSSAVSRLRRMGFTAHNIGSYNRAKKIVSG